MRTGLRFAAVCRMNIIHAARRLALVALASLALSGCETLTNMATSVRDAFAPAPQSDAAVEAPPAPGTSVGGGGGGGGRRRAPAR